MTDKQMNRRPFGQHQEKTSGQKRQQQHQKHRPKDDHMTSPQTLGGQPGQQNAGSGQGKNSLNNFDIDTSGKTHK